MAECIYYSDCPFNQNDCEETTPHYRCKKRIVAGFARKNCEHYFECRLPLSLCNPSCKKYCLGDWVKIKIVREASKKIVKEKP